VGDMLFVQVKHRLFGDYDMEIVLPVGKYAFYYPRDAMLARVFAIATCPSVRHTPVLCLAERKQDCEMYTI